MSKIRVGEYATFWCPGCNEYHTVNIVKGERCYWDFTGSIDNPTINPSILIRSGHYASADANHDCWCTYEERYGEPSPYKCGVCHLFIRDGKIEYLSDSTHEYAGKTIDMVDMESLV